MKKIILSILIAVMCLSFQVIYAEESETPPIQDTPAQQTTETIVEKNTQNVTNAISKQAAVVYAYIPNQLYRVYCQEQRLVDIQLQTGEELIYIGGGDTVRWIVDKEISGSNNGKQWHVYVKPLKAGITTNLVINTDKHAYHLEMISTTWYTPVITWAYPQEEEIAFVRQKEIEAKIEQDTIPLGNGTLDSINFGYDISNKKYSWKPNMVFNDGSKTYIQMPASMKSGEAPALFVREGKELLLVNYRVKNNYYIVDRLFTEAELRCGKEIIKIKKLNN